MIFLVPSLALSIGQVGCGSGVSKPVSPPQPPTMKLSAFDAIEYAPTRLSPSTEQDEVSRAKIDQELGICMANVPSARGAGSGPPVARTVVLEPMIEEIRKVSTTARVLGGALAGGSGVRVSVVLRDQSTGEVLATPEFYNSANAMGAAYTFGVGDTLMLIEIAQEICNYVVENR